VIHTEAFNELKDALSVMDKSKADHGELKILKEKLPVH
jgi:hypothetical protein